MINESFDYLLKLPIYTLSQEEITKLQNEKAALQLQHEQLSKMSIESLWLEELQIFEKMYKKSIK